MPAKIKIKTYCLGGCAGAALNNGRCRHLDAAAFSGITTSIANKLRNLVSKDYDMGIPFLYP